MQGASALCANRGKGKSGEAGRRSRSMLGEEWRLCASSERTCSAVASLSFSAGPRQEQPDLQGEREWA